MKKQLLSISSILIVSAIAAQGASLTMGARTNVSQNNANFDISVNGDLRYNDRGVGGVEPGAPTTDYSFGAVVSYNFVGNNGTGSPLTTYASGGSRTPTPTAPGANVHGPGEEWSNVWTTNTPGSGIDFSGGDAKNHNPTGIAGATNTFSRAALVDGTIDISGLDAGQVHFPHGTFINQWSLTLTMTGAGQSDLVVADAATVNGASRNFGWISDFTFDNTGDLYDTISYNYTNADADGSRARFMGVIVTEVPEPSGVVLLGLSGFGFLLRRRR
jgi:hypothetical protein